MSSKQNNSRFKSVVEVLVKEKVKSRKSLIEFLCKSQSIRTEIPSLFKTLAKSEKKYREEYILLICELLSEIIQTYTPEEQVQFAIQISQFPNYVTRYDTYMKIVEAVKKMTPKSDSAEDVYYRINEKSGPFKVIVVAALSEQLSGLQHRCLNEISSKLTSNIPAQFILAFLHILSFIPAEEVSRTDFSPEKLKVTVNDLLSRNTDLDNKTVLRLLLDLHKIYPGEEFCGLFTNNAVQNLKKLLVSTRDYDSYFFNLFEILPSQSSNPEFTVATQISSFLAPLSSLVKSYDDPILEKIYSFILPRKSDSVFNNTFILLTTKADTYRASLMIGIKTRLLYENNTLYEKCFPSVANPETSGIMLDFIPKAIEEGLISTNNIGTTIKAIIAVIENEKLIYQTEIQENLNKALDLLIDNYHLNIIEAFIKDVTRINSIDVINKLVKLSLDHFPSDEIITEKFNQVDYFNLVTSFSRFVTSRHFEEDKQNNMLELILKLSNILVSSTNEVVPDLPITVSNYLTFCIPSNVNSAFIGNAYKLLETNKSFVIVLSTISKPSSSEKKKIDDAVGSLINHIDLYAIYYSSSIAYNSHSFSQLLKNSKNNKNGIINKKSSQLAKCILATITYILYNLSSGSCKKNLDNKNILKLIYQATPKENFKIVQDEVCEMVNALSKCKQIEPKEKFVVRLIQNPVFFEYIPGLLSKVKPKDGIFALAVRSWIIRYISNTISKDKSQRILEMLLGYLNSPKALEIFIETIMPFLQKEENVIETLKLSIFVSQYCIENGIKYHCDPTNLILITCSPCLSLNDDTRIVATTFFVTIFELNDFSESYKSDQPASEVKVIFVELFQKIFEKILAPISVGIFEKIVDKSAYTLSDLLMMRVIVLLYHAELLKSKKMPLEKILLFKPQKSDPENTEQIHKIILCFAENQTKAFVRYIYQAPINEVVVNCIPKIFQNNKIRDLFLEEMILCTAEIKKASTASSGFKILLDLIPLNLNGDFNGILITLLLLWYGILFYDKNIKNESINASHLKDISVNFGAITRTKNINFSVESLNSLITTVQYIVENILYMEFSQIELLIKSFQKATAASNEATFIITGILFLEFFSRFTAYSAQNAKQLQTEIIEIISGAFEHGRGLGLRMISCAFNNRIDINGFLKMPENTRLIIFKSVNNSILEKISNYLDETANLFCWMLYPIFDILPQDNIINFQTTIQKIFEKVPLTSEILRAILFLVNKEIHIIETTTKKAKLSYANLLILSIKGKKEENDNLIFDILKSISKTEDEFGVINFILEQIKGTNELKTIIAEFSSGIQIEAVTPRRYNYMLALYAKKAEYHSDKKDEFKHFVSTMFKLTIGLSGMPQHPCHELALDSILKL
ncbi:hypothetical protein GPJ56_000168 [Histomonas meleagridis]|uniref:uncharacterized protein n=1 Tax=Histomonas meleagridis TaxID=135588 RepID=UPI00355AB963|nr:hypothetical protein GPJ56_000168 [Histomonas meleagridis]KAH0806582.1 hypothetical protein GO595_000744 [Histomonas meleagridis]